MVFRVSLKVKLVGAFLIIALLIVTAGYFSSRTFNVVHESFSDITNSQVPQLNILRDMQLLAVEIDAQASIYENEQTSVGDSETQKDQILVNIDKLAVQEDAFEALLATLQGHMRVDTEFTFRSIVDAKEKAVVTTLDLISLKEQRASANAIAEKEVERMAAGNQLEEVINVAVRKNLQTIEEEKNEVDDQAQRLRRLTLFAAAGTTFVGLLLGAVISITISRNLRKLKEGATAVAGGNFARRIDINSRDELGELGAVFNQMSERLRDSYRRLGAEKQRDEAIFQSVGEGMVAIDEKGHIVIVNSVALNLMEQTDQSVVVERPIFEFLQLLGQDGKSLPIESNPITVALRSGQAVDDVFAFKRQDGRQVLFNVDANPIVLEGSVIGAIIVMRDVTKEKEIDRMKTEFISLASHQLRTPLSAIKWFSEMLLSGDAGELQPEQQDFAKNIADSTERMIQLVNSLLNISRIESGRIMVDPKPTDLSELVSGIINDLKAKTEEKQQSLVISVHSDLPKINLDPRLIGQVYLNLLTNAIKYTPKGGEISVFISKKGDEVISQVTDNGYGIPKDQHDRIFQKFFRAANAVKVETDGTGLGLYLIKSIIESSGGKIWFESEENKGTTFWFSIPLSGMKPKEGEVTLDV